MAAAACDAPSCNPLSFPAQPHQKARFPTSIPLATEEAQGSPAASSSASPTGDQYREQAVVFPLDNWRGKGHVMFQASG